MARVYLAHTTKAGRKVYGVDYVDNGGRRVRTSIGPKAAAQKALGAALAELAEERGRASAHATMAQPPSPPPAPVTLTLAELGERWRVDRERRGKRSLERDLWRWPLMVEGLGGPDRQASTLTVDDVERLRGWLGELTLPKLQQLARKHGKARAPSRTISTPAARNRYLQVLAAALRLAQKNGWVSWAPPITYEQEAKPRDRIVTDAEFQAIFELALPHMRRALLLGRYGALRLGEALTLTWDRCHLEGDEPWVRVGTEAKTALSANRPIPLPRKTAQTLLVDRPPWGEGLVCPNAREKPWAPSDASHMFRRLAARAGVEQAKFHDLRHTRLTELGDAVGDLGAVADIAGHTSLQTTRRYVHRRPEKLRKSLKIE